MCVIIVNVAEWDDDQEDTIDFQKDSSASSPLKLRHPSFDQEESSALVVFQQQPQQQQQRQQPHSRPRQPWRDQNDDEFDDENSESQTLERRSDHHRQQHLSSSDRAVSLSPRGGHRNRGILFALSRADSSSFRVQPYHHRGRYGGGGHHHRNLEEEAGLLPEDTYSLLAFVNTPLTLILSLGALGVQLATLVLLALDIMDFEDSIQDDPLDYEPDNPLGIPASVSGEVAIAQLLALIITLLSESNVLWSLNVYLNGFHREQIVRLLQAGRRPGNNDNNNNSKGDDPRSDGVEKARLVAPKLLLQQESQRTNASEKDNHTRCDSLFLRWHIANVLRLIVGVASLTATFVLIVQSGAVVEILLNFTAIEFISQIDNAVFLLAKWGHFGRIPQRDADQPIIDESNFTIHQERRTQEEHGKVLLWNAISRFLLYVIFLGGWIWIFVKQTQGRYQASSLLLQFGDPTDLELATYTGIYRRSDKREDTSRRFRYVNVLGRGELQWCRAETAWVFVDPLDLVPERPCGWKVISSKDQSFDILNVADEPWFLDIRFNIRTPVDEFKLTAHSYRPRGSGGAQQEVDCPAGSFGWNCEFSSPCPILAISEAAGPFMGDKSFPKEFRLLDPHLSVYSRPVYVGEVDGVLDVILFTGRRWLLMTSLNQLAVDGPVENDLAAFVEQLRDFTLHEFDPVLGIRFVSEPMDVGTALDAVSPVGLQWFRTSFVRQGEGTELDINEDVFVTTRLICGVCESDSDCNFNGLCVDGSCKCPVGAHGRACEVSPIGNGHCNAETNSLLYEYDGGDCCLTTCVHSEEFACGRDALGYAEIGNVLCRDPRLISFDQSVDLESPGTFEFGRSIAMNEDGTRLAVGSIDSLVSYYNIGRGWTAESTANEGIQGFSVLMSQTMRGSINNPLAPSEVNAIVGGRKNGVNFVNALNCNRNVCRNEEFLENDQSQPIERIELPDPPEVTAQERLVPFPLAATISGDGRFLFTGGFSPVAWIWESQFDFWFRVGGWTSTRYALYLSISRSAFDREDQAFEFTVAIGEKDFGSYPDHVNQPLIVTVHRVRGDATNLQDTQLGSAILSDYHMLHLKDQVLRVPGDFFTNGELAASGFLTDDPLFAMPEESVIISRDGNVLAISSFFVVGSELKYHDVYGGGNSSTVDPDLEAAFFASLRGRVDVYEWQNETDWGLRQAIDLAAFRDPSIEHGWTTSMSTDGAIVIVGTTGGVRAYLWNPQTKSYMLVGGMPGGPGVSVALSGDALSVAVGYPLEGLNGVVRIFRSDVSNPCAAEALLLQVSFTTGTNSQFTYYQVRRPSGQVEREGGPRFLDNHQSDFSSNMTFSYKECFSEDLCSSFVLLSFAENPAAEGTLSAFFNQTTVPFRDTVVANGTACELAIFW